MVECVEDMTMQSLGDNKFVQNVISLISKTGQTQNACDHQHKIKLANRDLITKHAAACVLSRAQLLLFQKNITFVCQHKS